MADDSKQDEDNKLKIPHQPSNTLTSQFASGVIFAGPGPDGLYQLVFYKEALRVMSETGIKNEDGAYTTHIESDDLFQFREDVAVLSVPISALEAFKGILIERFPDDSPSSVDEDKENG